MRKKFEQVTLVLMLSVPICAMAQTGQTLIGNPLLSPGKMKEVKRQIVEAAHKELVPLPAPTPLPPLQINPVPMMEGLPPGMSGGDPARQMLSRLQVMAIVGDTALLALHTPSPSGKTSQIQTPQMPTSQMYGFPSGSDIQQVQQTTPTTLHARRTSSVLIRHHETTFVEGFEVTPIVKGDSVRLVLKAMPNETVFYGAIQPALYSPSATVAVGDLQKPNTDYVNIAKPDTTSMSGAGGYSAAGQSPAQAPVQPGFQMPVQQR